MATKETNYLVSIHKELDASLDRNMAALPQGFNKARFMQNCMAMIQDGTADFSRCDPRSVVRTLLKGSFLGLDFFNKECYAIPYGNQVQFQTDYKGLIKLAKRYASPPIKEIYAKLVRDGDDFQEEIENGRQSVTFRPKPFNDGDVLGAFAVCLFQDGSMIYDTMSHKEIENTHSHSQSKNSPAWANYWGEMAKKTVLRRLCKLITLDFDTLEQVKAFGSGEDFAADIKDVVEEETASVVIEMPEQPEPIGDDTPLEGQMVLGEAPF